MELWLKWLWPVPLTVRFIARAEASNARLPGSYAGMTGGITVGEAGNGGMLCAMTASRHYPVAKMR